VEISQWDEVIEDLINVIDLRQEEVDEMRRTLAEYRRRREEDEKK
jgi:hypothetical protein